MESPAASENESDEAEDDETLDDLINAVTNEQAQRREATMAGVRRRREVEEAEAADRALEELRRPRATRSGRTF